MAATKWTVIEIVCDDCGCNRREDYIGNGSLLAEEKEAKREGWYISKDHKTVYCPNCLAKQRERG